MKIKHWQGYGSVNMKVLLNTPKKVIIEVYGNHEYGLERYKNMPKYGDTGIEHTFVTKSEEAEEVEEAEENEEVEEKDEEEKLDDNKEKDNNLIAQIFEKLIS